MRITQRQSTFGLLAILLIVVVISLLVQAVRNDFSEVFIGSSIAFVSFGGLAVAYWRGWEYARHAILVILSAITIYVLSPRDPNVSIVIIIAPIIALMLTSVPWIIGSAVVIYIGAFLRVGLVGSYGDPIYILAFIICIAALVLTRVVLDSALRDSKDKTRQVEEALAQATQQGQDLARQSEVLATQNEEQRRLLDLVMTLETPTVVLADGVLLAPVVGALDSRRAQALTQRLLESVGTQRARMVVLDISGVPTVDTAVSHALVRSVQALRLIGCEVTITGISALVAATMTQMGVQLDGIRTARSPQDALVIGTR